MDIALNWRHLAWEVWLSPI